MGIYPSYMTVRNSPTLSH